jgi:hypothetical protein
LIDVGWDETNKKFPFHAELVDGDGHQVMTQTELGEQPLQMDGVLEAGRPPGHPPGSPVRIAFSVGFGPLNLSAGQRYEWRVSIDGDHDENWSAGFNVVVPVPGPGQA